MKKVIYGVLVLLGICLVSTNFILDNKKIDYKQASASGTACKWISESGYGVGPYYLEGISYTGTGLEYTRYYKYSNGSWNEKYVEFSVLPCDSTSAQITRDGYRIYEIDGSQVTATNGLIFYNTDDYDYYEVVYDGLNYSKLSGDISLPYGFSAQKIKALYSSKDNFVKYAGAVRLVIISDSGTKGYDSYNFNY